MHAHATILAPPTGWPSPRLSLGMRWAALTTTVALAILTVAGSYLSGVGRPAGNAPGTSVAAVSAAATPVPGGTPTSPPAAGATGKPTTCLADARPPGAVTGMIAATSWRVPRTFPISSGSPPTLDGDYYTGQYPAFDDAGAVGEIDDALADLWACRMYTMDRYTDQDPDNQFWAHFSDNALRRVYGDIPASAGSPLNALQPRPLFSWQAAPRVSRAFDVEEFDPGVQRVGVVLTPPVSCLARPASPQPTVMMIFANEGRWVIDEVAIATFSANGESVLVDEPDHLDIAIFDAGGGGDGGNPGGAYTCETIFFADEDVIVFVHNPGVVAHSLRIPELGVYLILQPNTSQRLVINVPVDALDFREIENVEAPDVDAGGSGVVDGLRIASVDYAIYQAGSSRPIGDGRIEFAPPGTPRPRG